MIENLSYRLVDGGLLEVKVDPRKTYRCPFCNSILRWHVIEGHIRQRLLLDLQNIVGECRALQLSHAVRRLDGAIDHEIHKRCQREHKSRTEIIMEQGDPFTWELE